MKKIIIAIDGPAGSGKTTSARNVARNLDYIYIDTGAMYRAVTLECFRQGIMADDTKSIIRISNDIKVELTSINGHQRTFLNGEDVSDEIRTPQVTLLVSPVSAVKEVREKLVEMQRQMGCNGGVVMDGRDIGTVVFPQAELKIFLVASVETRAMRRYLENKNKIISEPLEVIQKLIIERDRYDSSRENSPLKQAEDAILIDTSKMTIEEQTQKIISLAKKIINN